MAAKRAKAEKQAAAPGGISLDQPK